MSKRFAWGEFDPVTNARQYPLHKAQADILYSKARFIFAFAGTGGGKCFGKDTQILMFDGSRKKVQDIKIGDLVMGNDSKPRKVLATTKGFEPLYKISRDCRNERNRISTDYCSNSYIVNQSHILALRSGGKFSTSHREYKNNPYRVGKTPFFNIPLTEYLKASGHFKHTMKGYRTAVEFPFKEVKIDPYFLGLWLGDGTARTTGITTADNEIVEYVYEEAVKRNLSVTIYHTPNNAASTYSIVGTKGRGGNSLTTDLHFYRLIKNKHIPQDYLTNNRKVRLSLLAGLLDTDGNKSKESFEFVNKSEAIANGVMYLARSLGFSANITICHKVDQNGNGGNYYRLYISGDVWQIPVRVKRKQCHKIVKPKYDALIYSIKVEPIGEGEYFGFSIDGNQLFLLGDFTVVHNSVLIPLWFAKHLERLLNGKFLLVVPSYGIFETCGLFEQILNVFDGTAIKPNWIGSRKLFEFNTGAKLYVRSAEYPDAIEGGQYDAVAIDEAAKVNRRVWTFAKARVGQTKGPILGVTTPDLNTWIYDEIFKRWKAGDPDYYVRQWSSLDNPTYSVDAFENARATMSKALFERRYLGKFVQLEGLVYESFADQIIPTPAALPSPAVKVAGGIDWGWNDPCAVSVLVECQDGRIYVVEEMFESHLPLESLSSRLKQLQDKWASPTFGIPFAGWYCDHSRPEIMDQLRRNNIPAKAKTVSLIETGISLVDRRIRTDYLRIYDCCQNLIEEAGQYQRKPDKDNNYSEKPIDKKNHLLDALRYCISGLDFGRKLSFAKQEDIDQIEEQEKMKRLGVVNNSIELTNKKREMEKQLERDRWFEMAYGDLIQDNY